MGKRAEPTTFRLTVPLLPTRIAWLIILTTLFLALRANWLLQQATRSGFVIPSLSSLFLWRSPSLHWANEAPENWFSSISDTFYNADNSDPCARMATPKPLPPRHIIPTVLFLHLPKCAGSTITLLLRHFAKITKGVGCAYLQDGESIPAYSFSPDGQPVNETHFTALGNESLPYRMAYAIRTSNTVAKLQLLAQGGCRTLRGHFTMSRLRHVESPVLMVTVLRDPIERFISMYDYGLKTQMVTKAWSRWFSAPTLNDELLNASSVLHLPFIQSGNQWARKDGQWISFFFYGALHQLSGMYPAFTGAGNIDEFGILNAEHMAEAAMVNLCRMHVVALQENTTQAIKAVVDATQPWANYSTSSRNQLLSLWDNKTPNATSRIASNVLSSRSLALLRKRLYHEYRVFHFAQRIVRYRNSNKARAPSR